MPPPKGNLQARSASRHGEEGLFQQVQQDQLTSIGGGSGKASPSLLDSTAVHLLLRPEEDRLLVEKQVASRWGVSVKKLQADRLKGTGCPFVRLSPGAVRYRLSDVLAYEQAALRRSTSEA